MYRAVVSQGCLRVCFGTLCAVMGDFTLCLSRGRVSYRLTTSPP